MAADNALDTVNPGSLNRKVALRLLPFLGLLMFVSYLDRIRDKTGRRRRAELTQLAIKEGINLAAFMPARFVVDHPASAVDGAERAVDHVGADAFFCACAHTILRA